MPCSRASLRMYAPVNGERRSTSDGPRSARRAAITASIIACRASSGTAPCAEPPTFFLGTHQPNWLTLGVPLFVSDRRLRRYRTLPRAAAPWALDSGGFTELSQYGTWDTGPTAAAYIARDPSLPRRDRPPGLGRPTGLDVRTVHRREDRPNDPPASAVDRRQLLPPARPR
jgi:hypothetical protein